MTNNFSPDRTARRQPVPIGLFLAPTHRLRRPEFARPGVPDWHGLPPNQVAYLIRHYTRFGDVVLDLDEHPTIAAAARYLRRAPAKLVTHGGASRVRLVPPPPRQDRPRRVVCRPGPGANLVTVGLPRTGNDPIDLHGLTNVLGAWRRLLRPGGHLIAALTAPRSESGGFSHRSTVIAAARAAGLLYHQHIPVLLVSLPEHDRRTDPDPTGEPADGRRLHNGCHVPVFRDLVVFASTAIAEEATRG
jgi:hypothetical protein